MSQDKSYFVRKSAWVSLIVHNFVYMWNNDTEISLSVIIRQLFHVIFNKIYLHLSCVFK